MNTPIIKSVTIIIFCIIKTAIYESTRFSFLRKIYGVKKENILIMDGIDIKLKQTLLSIIRKLFGGSDIQSCDKGNVYSYFV